MTSTPIKSYTDRLYYADGAVPRYSGCPSARLTSLGGRYDYRFDVHNRLIEADYTPGENASANEDFSVAYTYNKVGNPTRIERNGLTGYSSTNIELFGLLDNLLFSYDGNKLLRIITQKIPFDISNISPKKTYEWITQNVSGVEHRISKNNH